METQISEQILSELALSFGTSAGVLLASPRWVTYLVGPEMRIKHFLACNTDGDEQRDYEQYFAALDPLAPMACLAQDRWVATLGQMRSPLSAAHEEYQARFIRRYRIVDAIEIFLKSDADIILGFSMLRHDDAPAFSREDIQKAEALRTLGNFALSRTLPRRQASIEMIVERFPALTRREATLVQLVALGLSNKQLCRELAISLPTVKTHLLSVFRKMGVGSRTELAARVLT